MALDSHLLLAMLAVTRIRPDQTARSSCKNIINSGRMSMPVNVSVNIYEKNHPCEQALLYPLPIQ